MSQLLRLAKRFSLRINLARSTAGRAALSLALAAALLSVGTWGRSAVAEEQPTEVVRSLLDALKNYTDKKASVLSEGERESNARAIHVANESINVSLVAERTFGKRWATLSEEQRVQFVGLFKQLLEQKAYAKSSNFFQELTVEFLAETVQGEQATVETSVVHETEGEIFIDYRLKRDGGRWVILDVSLDGVSLALDLRSQVYEVLEEESFSALIQRMKDRLAES